MEFSLHIFGGEFSDNCSFKNMCREEHYYMTLPNETPPPSFPKYVVFFLGTAISQNSLQQLQAIKLNLFS